jgi:hypothetical protein
MTADNHDPFALGGGGHDGNTEGPTLEECAAIEFAPLSEDDRRAMYESLGKSKWNESARTLGITLRLALAVMEKSKDELVTAGRELMNVKDPGDEENDCLTTFIDNLQEAEEYLLALAQFAHDARVRQLSAASVVALGARP